MAVKNSSKIRVFILNDKRHFAAYCGVVHDI
jgi:hypothetical protein